MIGDIDFSASREDFDLIVSIAKRAETLGWRGERSATLMDLTACHLNGCPLDLARMAAGDPGDLMHDVAGIAQHINRNTGRLEDCFLPRFARQG